MCVTACRYRYAIRAHIHLHTPWNTNTSAMPNCITETVIQTFYPEYGKRDGTFDRSEKEQDKNVLFYPSDSLKKRH